MTRHDAKTVPDLPSLDSVDDAIGRVAEARLLARMAGAALRDDRADLHRREAARAIAWCFRRFRPILKPMRCFDAERFYRELGPLSTSERHAGRFVLDVWDSSIIRRLDEDEPSGLAPLGRFIVTDALRCWVAASDPIPMAVFVTWSEDPFWLDHASIKLVER